MELRARTKGMRLPAPGAARRRGGAGEKLKVVSGHIRHVPARGMEMLSEIRERRSDLGLEPEERRAARMTRGVAYPITGNSDM